MTHEPPLALPEPQPTESAAIATARHDGWLPHLRRLFLETLAETGRVSVACEVCRMSTQSAYALRNRDPLFAAGWDAACEFARAPLADALYERAVEGVTETLVRDGEVVAERKRYDSRLSIAVLNRLDKRADAARDQGAQHRKLLGRWDEWLESIGTGDEDGARELLNAPAPDPANLCQLHQLSLGENPTEEPPLGHFWDRNGIWWTSYPPPPGFRGFEQGSWGDSYYERHCTAEETKLLDREDDAAREERRRVAEEDRSLYFAELEAKLEGEGDSDSGLATTQPGG